MLVYSPARSFVTALYLKTSGNFSILLKAFYHLLIKGYLFALRLILLYAPLNYISHCSYLISAWRPLPLRIFSLLQAPIRTPRPRRTVKGLVRRHRVLSRIREVRTKTTTRCSKLEIQAVLFLCCQGIQVHTNFLFNQKHQFSCRIPYFSFCGNLYCAVQF